MSLNSRIFVSFALMAVVVIAIAWLGLSGAVSSNEILSKVIAEDLPAETHLGTIGRGFDSLRSNKNFLLNPNLTLPERQRVWATNKADLEALETARKEFDGYIKQIPRDGGPEAADLIQAWGEYQKALQDWLTTDGRMFELYSQWEETSILNPTALLGDLQRYRGDHYVLARRVAEMVVQGKAIGPEITTADDQCGFGKWRKNLEAESDLLGRNKNIGRAMEEIREHHRNFHALAGQIYALVVRDPADGADRARPLLEQLLQEADNVVGKFSMMIDEATKAAAIYQEAAGLSQGRLETERATCADNFKRVLAAKAAYDRWSKGLFIESGERNVTILEWAVGLALALSVILAAFVGRSIKKLLTGPLNRIIDTLSVDAEELSSVSNRLAATSSALSEGAGEQAASLEESSAAIEEMSSMTARNAESSSRADSMMSENAAQVKSGFTTVEQMAAAMEAINQSSEEIGRIIKTIEDIAFQTNILALNAAVEAARAGEAGQGFAVVADEVRNLAQRSAQASQDTRGLIEDTVNRVAAGRTLTRTIEEFFSRLTDSTVEVGRMINDINQATADQAQGMSQISSSVTMIDKVAGENVANAKDAASASDALSARAAGLYEAVQDLGRIIGRPADLRSAPFSAGRRKALPGG